MMKFAYTTLFILSALLMTTQAGSIFKMNVKERLSQDFLTGFESGIFLRNDNDQFQEYGCPDEKVDSHEFSQFKNAI